MANPLSDALFQAFRQLDHKTINTMVQSRPSLVETDRDKVAAAFGLIVSGNVDQGRELINDLKNDQTATAPDIAYIQGFLAEADGDFEKVLDVLTPHLGAQDASHGARMHLRIADTLVRLERFDDIPGILAPLLQPPGITETLEAQLIMMEVMLRTGAEHEKVVEQASLLDVMLDRGFRLPDGGNVIYYAELLEVQKIEAVIGKLLNAHEPQIDRYTPVDEDEMFFLLTAGEKYKSPTAVRAAARGYVKAPFEWEDLEADKVAFTFANHEEPNAARLTILTCYTESQINENQDLWGPLILNSYSSRQFKETLELIDRHADEIRELPVYPHAATITALCKFYMGLTDEALQNLKQLDKIFYEQAEGFEAAAEPLMLIRKDLYDELPGAVERAMTSPKAMDNPQAYANQYLNTVLVDLLIHEKEDALKAWLDALAKSLPAVKRREIIRNLTEVCLEWSYPDIALYGADLVEQDNPIQAEYIRGTVEAWKGNAEGFDSKVTEVFEKIGDQPKDRLELAAGRWYRRLGKSDKVRELVEPLAKEGAQKRSAALALLAGLAADEGMASTALLEKQKEIDEVIRATAKSREMAQQLFAEARHFFEGDTAERVLKRAEQLRTIPQAGVETLRVARWAATAYDADEATKSRAQELISEWKKVNLEKETQPV